MPVLTATATCFLPLLQFYSIQLATRFSLILSRRPQQLRLPSALHVALLLPPHALPNITSLVLPSHLLVYPSLVILPDYQDSLPTMSTAAPTKKRKLAEPKFYAVRAGHTAGVYTEWEDCKAQITGFKGAAFKSFPTRADAQAFVEGRDVALSTGDGPAIGKFYGVAVGLVPGVYTDWPTAQRQILGVKGPKYKKFSTRAEAVEFVESKGKGAAQLMNSDDAINVIKSIPSNSSEAFGEPPRKSRKVDTASGVKVESEQPITNVFQSQSSHNSTALRIYTDGSSLGNGYSGASAGVGVFFGIGDERNVSEPLKGERQTNQRAELTAIQRALEIVPSTQDVQIVTDSQYSINCVTKWCIGWEKNGWKNAKKDEVENQDLIKGVLAKMRERKRLGAVTDFIWIKGHSNDPGNEAADKLAVAGAIRK